MHNGIFRWGGGFGLVWGIIGSLDGAGDLVWGSLLFLYLRFHFGLFMYLGNGFGTQSWPAWHPNILKRNKNEVNTVKLVFKLNTVYIGNVGNS